MISKVEATFLVKEMPTDGHHPMLVLADDGNKYYCKYRLRMSKEIELDFLTYEVIGHVLLNWLSIPTPEIAFVELHPDSYSSKDVKFNRIPPEGAICFGSKEVLGRVLTETEAIVDKRDFNKLDNPLDLLKIAFFDQWVGNVDRGKAIESGGFNYNLLVADHQRYIAFDHAFIFGGENSLRVFNASSVGFNRNSLICTEYFSPLFVI